MMKALPLLAEAAQDMTEQMNDIHVRVVELYPWALEAMFYLSIATVILVIFLFLRQKKIAQNQVDLGKMLQHLMEK